jgi:hypothetical protein
MWKIAYSTQNSRLLSAYLFSAEQKDIHPILGHKKLRLMVRSIVRPSPILS